MSKRQPYRPPVQRGFGQFVDSLVLLVLVGLSLLAPLLFNSAESTAPKAEEAPATWEALQQNPTMQVQWQKLGFDAEKAAPIVRKKFHYEIEPLSLGITVAVIVAYFFFVLRVSDRQYREVIEERFGPRPPGGRSQ